jgi:hypothetical protein
MNGQGWHKHEPLYYSIALHWKEYCVVVVLQDNIEQKSRLCARMRISMAMLTHNLPF